MKNSNKHMKIWEIALLMSLAITFTAGIWARNEQKDLAKDLVRLHVVADSDSEEDQAHKLAVRDAVLNELSPKLSDTDDPMEAQLIIKNELPKLCYTAEKVLRSRGCFDSVRTSLEKEEFPTREYDTFSLPAGDYTSLRITIGSGKGHNWWCVVFPPLCLSATEEAEAFSTLDESEKELICGDYKLKFRLIEIFSRLKSDFARLQMN